MSSEVVCGVDIGSTSTKVVALDRQGRVTLRIGVPTPRVDGGLVRAPDLLRSVEQMLMRVGSTGHVIRAVCSAGVGEDGLLAGPGQRALCAALPWFHPERSAILRELAPELGEIPALPVATNAARTVVGWRWARRQAGTEPATAWVALADWPSAVWTGRSFISDTLAARTAAWLPQERAWLTQRVELTLGDAALLPEVVPTGTRLGELRSDTLAAAGVLAPDAMVVAGGHDHPVGGWGVQQMDANAIVDSMGTAEVVVAQSPRPDVPRSSMVDVAPAILGPGCSVLAVQELARNVKWAGQAAAVARELRRLVAGEVQPTRHLHADAFIPGAQGGGRPAFADDAPADPRARASAVLGRLARQGEDRLAAVAATLPGEPAAYATGGWSRSAGWMAIKETIAGRKIDIVAEPEVTAVAAALLAARDAGWDIPPAQAFAAPDDLARGGLR